MRTDFCTFLDSRDKNGAITIKPLGFAKNKVQKPTLPGWKDVVTEIVIDKNYAKGLDGIEDYSHVIIVYWMDKEKECQLKARMGNYNYSKEKGEKITIYFDTWDFFKTNCGS